MNNENITIARIVDRAFIICKEKFSKQFAITIFINLIYMAAVAAVLWIGYKIIPAAPPRITDIITRNLRHIVIAFIILLISLFFKFLVTSANIISANCEQSLIKSCLKTVKSIPDTLLFVIIQIIICLPIVIIFGFIAYASKFNQTVTLTLLLVGIIILSFINTLSMLSIAAYHIDNRNFINSIKNTFQIFRDRKEFLRFFGINILWSMIYWGFFIFVLLIVGFIFPAPSLFKKIPHSQYLMPIYKIGLTYLFTMFMTPVSKNILYAFCNTEQKHISDNFGFGSKLFAGAIDFYIQLAAMASVFYIMFIFLSRNNETAVITVNISFLAWLAIFLMLGMIMIIYKACFKFLLKRPTPGEKIIGIKKPFMI